MIFLYKCNLYLSNCILRIVVLGHKKKTVTKKLTTKTYNYNLVLFHNLLIPLIGITVTINLIFLSNYVKH